MHTQQMISTHPPVRTRQGARRQFVVGAGNEPAAN